MKLNIRANRKRILLIRDFNSKVESQVLSGFVNATSASCKRKWATILDLWRSISCISIEKALLLHMLISVELKIFPADRLHEMEISGS